MKQIQVTLLSILKNTTGWMTSIELSGATGLSVRTVKMHVKQLNQVYPNLIASSQKGYKLNAAVYEENLCILQGEDTHYNSQERVKYMLKAILLSHSAVLLDANNFAEELGVSSSTIQNDLRAMRVLLSEYELHLVTQKQNLYIEGEEYKIRRLMNSVLLGEIQEGVRDIDALKKVFPEYELEKLQLEIKSLTQAHQISYSDTSLFFLTLHVVVVLNRLESNAYIQIPKEVRMKDFTAAGVLVRSLVKYLAHEYNIQFPSSEIDELTTLFSSYQLVPSRYTNDSISTLVQNILDQTSAIYLIDLRDSECVKILSAYIQNFNLQTRQASVTKKPLTDMIKKKCPFIYEIAIFIFTQFQHQMNIVGNDDDIALLAIHLGNIMERKKEKNKLLCYFVSKEYTQFGEEFCQKAGMLYGNAITLEHYPSFSKLPKKRAALLISPVTCWSDYPADHFLQVIPFVNEKDMITLGSKINEIQTLYKSQSLKKRLEQLFAEKLFCTGTSFETHVEAIDHIVSIMAQNGYVESSHFQEVLEREKLSSTAFGKVAIPHSLKMDAMKTGVYVLIQKSGIKWGENQVQIVLLLTVNKIQRRDIQDIMECIADMMTDEKVVQRILDVHNYQEFMGIMYKYLS